MTRATLVQHRTQKCPWCNIGATQKTPQNTTKHYKTLQSKNSGKPLFFRLSAIYAE